MAVLGPSGCGKSVLLRSLSGLLPPTTGQVEFRGQPLYPMTMAKHRHLSSQMGIAFQKGGLIDALTVYENLELPLREAEGVNPSEIPERVEGALAAVGLSGNDSLFPHELSGGMQKRLGVARAFLLADSLVILDDPTAGLDPITSVAILELVAALKKRRDLAVVLVGSQPEEVLPLSDSLLFLEEGKVAARGPVREVLRTATGTAKDYFFREL